MQPPHWQAQLSIDNMCGLGGRHRLGRGLNLSIHLPLRYVLWVRICWLSVLTGKQDTGTVIGNLVAGRCHVSYSDSHQPCIPMFHNRPYSTVRSSLTTPYWNQGSKSP